MTLIATDKSDNLIFVKKTMTATEVARNFSEVLDAVEAGDEIEITRGKKAIAVLKKSSEPTANSVLLRKALSEHFAEHGKISALEAEDRIAAVRADRDRDLELEEAKWND